MDVLIKDFINFKPEMNVKWLNFINLRQKLAATFVINFDRNFC